jgi:hypothetical protein
MDPNLLRLLAKLQCLPPPGRPKDTYSSYIYTKDMYSSYINNGQFSFKPTSTAGKAQCLPPPGRPKDTSSYIYTKDTYSSYIYTKNTYSSYINNGQFSFKPTSTAGKAQCLPPPGRPKDTSSYIYTKDTYSSYIYTKNTYSSYINNRQFFQTYINCWQSSFTSVSSNVLRLLAKPRYLPPPGRLLSLPKVWRQQRWRRTCTLHTFTTVSSFTFDLHTGISNKTLILRSPPFHLMKSKSSNQLIFPGEHAKHAIFDPSIFSKLYIVNR